LKYSKLEKSTTFKTQVRTIETLRPLKAPVDREVSDAVPRESLVLPRRMLCARVFLVSRG
jgi:hypothetical protein